MTFWSDETLRERLPPLVRPFDGGNISCASYELGLGKEAYITPVHDAKISERVKQKLDRDGSVLIPKGQFAFLITDEIINVPEDAIAFISIKAGIKFRGLVNVSGFHVDPGYKGRLVFSVFNAGAADVKLHCDERVFLIWFASLDKPSSSPKKGKGFMSIPSGLLHGLAEESLSLPVLDKRLLDVEGNVKKILWTAWITVTLASLGFSFWKVVGPAEVPAPKQFYPVNGPVIEKTPVMFDYLRPPENGLPARAGARGTTGGNQDADKSVRK
ncbi:deoxycytidine triphosphate deaminase [Stenotrophomonas sp. ASS1]|uniref:dCTP deaminase domain-containing protein n=1 Tax=Stenotrophomonas sp. ASS1 TaxID=2282124 RepID=UPI00104A366E|nr:deoxycytidine triphosphate deaminase [Stenotrophomonas sp. ASS1]QBL39324.1 deoxycytidine triphosphate deaminase [Stenotrophomonas sp. ASS1]